MIKAKDVRYAVNSEEIAIGKTSAATKAYYTNKIKTNKESFEKFSDVFDVYTT